LKIEQAAVGNGDYIADRLPWLKINDKVKKTCGGEFVSFDNGED
jgi:hypothetical protein